MDLQAVANAGVAALTRGDARDARQLFEQIVAAGRASPQLWLLLAQSCDMLDDRPAAHAAAERVLAAEAGNLYALLIQGDLYRRDGDDRAAVGWYSRALRLAAQHKDLPADLIQKLRNGEREHLAAIERFRAHLERSIAKAGVANIAEIPRFAEALGILSGTQQAYFQEPTSFFYPGLPHRAFYEAQDFPWAGALEAACAEIAEEAAAILASNASVVPYVENDPGRPSRNHDLLGNANWSACHIWKNGSLTADVAERCPRTVAALSEVAMPDIRLRSPMALFSILKPGTHIPPHNGMLNTRLIVHLPLIVPPGCRLRVGNETREVEAGKLMIFDDSIQHEAWNDSDSIRTVLLFEIWRLELSAAERTALTAMYEAINLYNES
jgi:aspartyl/asparaginyl beta-hydroxylase (cupin superfamily)